MILMEQCKKCRCYDKEWDRLFKSDVIFEDERDKMHFCTMYMGGMPMSVVNGQKECKYFWKKERRFPLFRSR